MLFRSGGISGTPGRQKLSYATETIVYFTASLSSIQVRRMLSVSRLFKTVVLCSWPTDHALVHDTVCCPVQGGSLSIGKTSRVRIHDYPSDKQGYA